MQLRRGTVDCMSINNRRQSQSIKIYDMLYRYLSNYDHLMIGESVTYVFGTSDFSNL